MGGVLLDTHVVLWWGVDDRHLGRRARATIESAGSIVVSDVTMWEVAIKVKLGKLNLDRAVSEWFSQVLDRQQVVPLPIDRRHIAAIPHLPLHHRDPWDRMLIAQATAERLAVLTADRQFQPYGVDVLDARV